MNLRTARKVLATPERYPRRMVFAACDRTERRARRYEREARWARYMALGLPELVAIDRAVLAGVGPASAPYPSSTTNTDGSDPHPEQR